MKSQQKLLQQLKTEHHHQRTEIQAPSTRQNAAYWRQHGLGHPVEKAHDRMVRMGRDPADDHGPQKREKEEVDGEGQDLDHPLIMVMHWRRATPAQQGHNGKRMRPPTRDPIWIPAGSSLAFPDPRYFEPHGLIAGGGDLSPARLMAAYSAGIFPWYDEPPILWWCPDPRAVITQEGLHVSRSLKRVLCRGPFRVTVDCALSEVLAGCGDRAEGTWLNSSMRRAYLELAQSGAIKSYEVWQGQELVGGLYGVLIGGLFAAESMFHRVTNASKVALVSSVLHLFAAGIRLYDVQFITGHLARMGAIEVSRSAYLDELPLALDAELTWPQAHTSEDLLPWIQSILSPSRKGPQSTHP